MIMIRFLFLSIIFITSLFSDVRLDLPKNSIKGEALNFSITISGNDIVLPKLDLIASNSVHEISSSISTNIVNSKIIRSIKKVYSFYPQKDFIFPSLKFIIDGKEYFTKERKIVLKTLGKTKSSLFDLSIKVNKKELYVSENFLLTLVFKYKKNPNIVDLSFEKPNFDNFWYKQLKESKQYEEKGFIVQELKFLLFPLKEGVLKINPLKINARLFVNDSSSVFSNKMSNIRIYSNELELDIKKLPSNINLIGDFDIKTKVDKTKIKQGEAVSFKLEINANGNIDDISDIKLNLDNATVYENKPKIETKYENGKYIGKYTKVFSIVPNKSIIIPKINLEYFDKKTRTVILKQSDEIKINVVQDSVLTTNQLIQKPIAKIKEKEVIKVIEKISIKDRIIFFTLGIIAGILILGLYLYVIKYKVKRKSNDTPLLKRVKKAKNKNELLKILAVYIKIDSSLDKLIFQLENENDIKLIKKDVVKRIKEINL
ncbi:BatD family protein [Poseidonibacter antarcticus]|uniref:BatD family protein n=1 Tax=Poseidonibacter antarcticus TaxID=2478538 RepID=UPI000EF4C2F1|nr:BatD family protein [Poseidonibacter antarcticus]